MRELRAAKLLPALLFFLCVCVFNPSWSGSTAASRERERLGLLECWFGGEEKTKGGANIVLGF
jgi:hypothetical protein